VNDDLLKLIGNSKIANKTVFVEGPDYAGKSTLIRTLAREYNFGVNNFMSNRGFPTSIVYSKLYNRNIDFAQQYYTFERQLNSNKNLFFFLLPSLETLYSRMGRGDDFINERTEITKIHELFSEFIEKYEGYGNIFVFTDNEYSSHIHLFDCSNGIQFDLNILVKTLSDRINNTCYNYSLSYFYDSVLDLIHVGTGHCTEISDNLYWYFDDYFHKFIKPDYKLTYEKDMYDVNMLYSQLQFNSHIQIDVNKEKLTSRRFIATNNTSCLSLFQVNIDENADIHVSVTMRSSDAVNLLAYDMKYIFIHTANFIKEFLQRYKFVDLISPDDLKTLSSTKVYITINLNNVHVMNTSKE
jgi:hypothetical protein